MWWSSKNKKKKKSSRGRKKKPSSGASFNLADVRPILMVFGWMVAVVVVSAGWITGRPHLISYVESNDQHPVLIEFSAEVVSVEGLEEELVQRALAAARRDAVGASDQQALVQRVRDAMAATGWFAEGIQVRFDFVRHEGETVHRMFVDGDFRHPAAMIRYEGLDHVVDETGVRLPLAYRAGDVDLLPTLLGVHAARPDIGVRWPGADVGDGMSLVRYLNHEQPEWWDEVRTIDVTNFDGSGRSSGAPRLVLTSHDGFDIGWGRAIGQEGGIEIPAHEKLALLNDDFRVRRQLGHPQGMLMVNHRLMTLDR